MGNVVTIQRTSKGWKSIRAMASLAFLIGVLMMVLHLVVASESAEVAAVTGWWTAVLGGSVALYLIARIGGWWFHA